MKIALINGSPKAKNSASASLLLSLKTLLPEGHEMMEYHLRTAQVSEQDLKQIAEHDVLVFAFPLYVDGVPAHLVSCLYQLETLFKARPSGNTTAYALVNCGFYEGQQATIALDIMKNWCDRATITWGQGIGIGGGGMLSSLANVPDGQGPKKNFSEAIKKVAVNMASGTRADNLFVSPNFPRFAYKLGAEMGWRQQIKIGRASCRERV